MVVFNHTGNNGYKMYLDVMDQPMHSLILGYSAFIKIAVPLFFMASGALLLKCEEPYSKILLKRVLRFVIVLVVVSFIFYYEAYGRKGEMSVSDFLSICIRMISPATCGTCIAILAIC
jgi:surface polysaccharide O-acyltransferase-like enzyme